MIKFFRKIRYNLIAQNKTGKYLKYAIGEIVLVVLGILIALSINNWNEDRKQKIIEIQSLKEIHASLDRLNYEVLLNLKDETRAQLACKHILDNFTNNKGYNDSLGMSFSYAWKYSFFIKSDIAYEFIRQNGANIISNQEVRSNIAKFFNVDLNATTGAATVRGNYIESLKLLMASWFKSIDYNLYDTGISEPINYHTLRLNNEFRFHVKTQLIYCNSYIVELSSLSKGIRKKQEMINIEISRLEKN